MKIVKRVCVISTVHPDHDTRILKQSKTLSEYFDVSLVIQSNKRNINSINIIRLPIIKKRIQRPFLMVLALFYAARKKYDFYIFHDPELIFVGVILKFFGKNVIYDIHEDYEMQILDKHWIPSYLRKAISRIFFIIEKTSSKFFNHVICATPYIHKKFEKITSNAICVRNFPPKNELYTNDYYQSKGEQNEEQFKILYVGVISDERCILNILNAIQDIECEFILAGKFSPKGLKEVCMEHPSWNKVRYLGFINRDKFSLLLKECDLGLLLFKPINNHIDSMPNKMFEYMSGGLFQLSSNFAHWKEIIEKNEIGVTVNPINEYEISSAIIDAKKNRSNIAKKRNNIRNTFLNSFTWEKEASAFLKAFDINDAT